jgi:Fe2+ or Zn2+ uptake regulation protein
MAELKTKKDISDYLKDQNISPTAQRVEMAHLLLKKPQHLSAEDVYTKVNDDFAKASRATIYNNLNLFVELGILKKRSLISGLTLYDTNSETHYHLFDENKDALFDIDSEDALCKQIADLAIKLLKKSTGNTVSIQDITINYKK